MVIYASTSEKDMAESSKINREMGTEMWWMNFELKEAGGRTVDLNLSFR
jgi:hypothetical protein